MIKSLIFPLILIGVAVGVVLVYALPVYETVQGLEREKDSYEVALAQVDEILKIEDDLRQQYESFSTEDREGLRAMLPDRVDPIEAIVEVNGIANDSNVSVIDVEIGGDDENSNQRTNSSSSEYENLDIEYTIAADYENFKTFLSNLETGLRLTDVNSIGFQPSSESEFMEFSVATSTYWLSE